MTNVIISLVYSIIVVSIVLVIVAENRNPLKAFPWILVVLFVPIVGVLLYYLFGEDLRRERMVNKRVFRNIVQAPLLFNKHFPKKEQDYPDKKLQQHLIEEIGNSPRIPYEQLDIFTEGKSMFHTLLQDLKEARHHIHLEYYAFIDDEIGNAVAESLIAKRRQGVKVRVIYDDVGSWGVKRQFWKKMKKAGIEVYPFMRVVFPFFSSRVNFRNHRKIIIIDSRIGYIGGMNIADRYYKGNNLGIWRDTHFRVTGEAVQSFQSNFLLLWNVVSRRIVKIKDYFPDLSADKTLTLAQKDVNRPSLQVISGAPTGKWRTIELALISIIARAKKSIDIETPYFLPTKGILDSLCLAALSGIRIRLLIPEEGDNKYVHIASMSYIEEMLEAGVEVYFYQQGFLHSKIISVDNEIAIGGSANLDFRSLEHNFEIVSVFYDATTSKRLTEIFEKDLLASTPSLSLERWRKRSFVKKFTESVMRLFSPLL